MTSILRRFSNILCSLFRHEQWNIGIVRAPISAFLEPQSLPPVEWLPGLKREEYRADPFGLQQDDKLHIFFEHYDQFTGIGTLRHIEFEDGKITAPSKQLVHTSVHASYPHIFQYDGMLYSLAETKRAGEVVLFRSEGSLDQWKRIKVLIQDDACTDPTIVEHKGRWYIICGGPGIDKDHDLYIWHADNPLGTWVAHRHNPVKTGDRRSRPGGTFFNVEDSLYRPAQDAEKTYGGGLAIYKVLALSPDDFEEELVTEIHPDSNGPFPDGIHTLSAAGDITLIDAKRYIFTFGGFWRRAGSIMRKLCAWN